VAQGKSGQAMGNRRNPKSRTQSHVVHRALTMAEPSVAFRRHIAPVGSCKVVLSVESDRSDRGATAPHVDNGKRSRSSITPTVPRPPSLEHNSVLHACKQQNACKRSIAKPILQAPMERVRHNLRIYHGSHNIGDD